MSIEQDWTGVHSRHQLAVSW